MFRVLEVGHVGQCGRKISDTKSAQMLRSIAETVTQLNARYTQQHFDESGNPSRRLALQPLKAPARIRLVEHSNVVASADSSAGASREPKRGRREVSSSDTFRLRCSIVQPKVQRKIGIGILGVLCVHPRDWKRAGVNQFGTVRSEVAGAIRGCRRLWELFRGQVYLILNTSIERQLGVAAWLKIAHVQEHTHTLLAMHCENLSFKVQCLNT